MILKADALSVVGGTWTLTTTQQTSHRFMYVRQQPEMHGWGQLTAILRARFF